MKLAAIDIGSNAIRLQIVNVFEGKDLVSFKKLEFLRFPLRLGKDVFKNNRISQAIVERYIKLMKAFKLLMDLYEVDNYYAVATSAMREAENGKEVRDLIQDLTGIDIHIIPGHQEAKILNKAIIPFLGSGYFIHIDVGGGSTEVNIFKNRHLIDSKSYKLGSVRKSSIEKRKALFEEIQNWLQSKLKNTGGGIQGIGTGGNINKLFKLSQRASKTGISLVELKALRAYIKAFSYEERMSILKMNPDRADVIIPASEIYIKILKSAGADSMLVPRVGLKDGILYDLYEQTTQKDILELEFIQDF